MGLVSNRLGNRKLVQLGICLAAVGATVFALPQVFGPLASIGLVLMGLGCAPIFPSLMHETARRFPPDVARTVIGRQMSLAYVGGSVVPAAFGLVGAVMNEIVTSIDRVTSVMSEIAGATQEQAQGISQVSTAVTDLDQMTQQNAALVEQSAAAADSLRQQAMDLSQAVSRFKISA